MEQSHTVFTVGRYLPPCTDIEVSAANGTEQYKAGNHGCGKRKAFGTGLDFLLWEFHETDGKKPPDNTASRAGNDFCRKGPGKAAKGFRRGTDCIKIPWDNRRIADSNGIMVTDAKDEENEI